MMETHNLFSGLQQVRDMLTTFKQIQNEQNDNPNFSKTKNFNQNRHFIGGQFSDSPEQQYNGYSSNSKFLNNLETPNKSIVVQKYINQNSVLQENNFNVDSQQQSLQASQYKNQKAQRASEQMENMWFRQTIDNLCEDNQILHKNSEESYKIIQILTKKLGEQVKIEKQCKELQKQKELWQNAFLKEQKEKKILNEKLTKVKCLYQGLKEKIQETLAQQISEQSQDEVLFNQIMSENQQLRSLLKINYTESQLKSLEKSIENEECEFFQNYCTTEEKPSEIEIKFMAKRKGAPSDGAKKFSIGAKQGKNKETPNVVRGDVANLADILGSQFSQQIQKGIKDNMMQFNNEFEQNDLIFVDDNDNEIKVQKEENPKSAEKNGQNYEEKLQDSPVRKIQKNKEEMLKIIQGGKQTGKDFYYDDDDDEVEIMEKNQSSGKKLNFDQQDGDDENQELKQPQKVVENFMKKLQQNSQLSGKKSSAATYMDLNEDQDQAPFFQNNQNLDEYQKRSINYDNNDYEEKNEYRQGEVGIDWDDYNIDGSQLTPQEQEEYERQVQMQEEREIQQQQKKKLNSKQQDLAKSFANFEEKLRKKKPASFN